MERNLDNLWTIHKMQIFVQGGRANVDFELKMCYNFPEPSIGWGKRRMKIRKDKEETT